MSYNEEKGYFTTTRVDEIIKNPHKKISNGGWKDNWGYAFDEALCNSLSKFFKKEGGSVVDLGCGSGAYTKYLRNNGISCDCCDGNPATPLMTDNLCEELDLSRDEHRYVSPFDFLVFESSNVEENNGKQHRLVAQSLG